MDGEACFNRQTRVRNKGMLLRLHKDRVDGGVSQNIVPVAARNVLIAGARLQHMRIFRRFRANADDLICLRHAADRIHVSRRVIVSYADLRHANFCHMVPASFVLCGCVFFL